MGSKQSTSIGIRTTDVSGAGVGRQRLAGETDTTEDSVATTDSRDANTVARIARRSSGYTNRRKPRAPPPAKIKNKKIDLYIFTLQILPKMHHFSKV